MKHNTRWIILGLIIAASFTAYVLRSNVSIVAANMSADLGLSARQLGWVFAAFAAGYAIFQFPGGLLGNKLGGRLIITVVAVSAGILTIVTALIPGSDAASVSVIFGSLLVIRFLFGMTQAPLFPCMGGTIANWFPQGGWGLPNGLSSTGLTLGAAATAPLIVWLMTLVGWRGALLVTVPAAFVLAGAWWWYVRDYPRDHRSVTPRELALIDANRYTVSGEGEKGDWLKVLKNRDVLLLTAGYFCMNYVFYLFFNWFFYFLTEVKGFSGSEAGFLTASLWVLGAIGATAGGIACDYSIKKLGFRWGPASICATGLLFCGLLLYLGAIAENSYVAVTLFCLSFALTQITEASFWATTMAVSGRLAASAGGVLNTGGNVVGFVGGILVPITADMFGWTAAIATGSIFACRGRRWGFNENSHIWCRCHGFGLRRADGRGGS